LNGLMTATICCMLPLSLKIVKDTLKRLIAKQMPQALNQK
jgi:molybdopterin biosynthesis enzyme MoaB